MSKKINDIAVIGMGRFGQAVVSQLIELKKHVLAIDEKEENLIKVGRICNTAILDASDVDALKGIGIERFQTVIVAATDNIEVVAALAEAGVKSIIAKSSGTTHERVLKLLKVDFIVKPEYEAGIKAALIATNSNFIKYSTSLNEVGDGFAMGSTSVTNKTWVGLPLKDLEFQKYGVSVVSIKRGAKVFLPTGMFQLAEDDLVTIIGKTQNITVAFGVLNDSQISTEQIKIKKASKAKIKI